MSPQAPSYAGITLPAALPEGDLLKLNLPAHRMIIATETICITLTTLFVAARMYTKWAVLRKSDFDDCEFSSEIAF